MMIYSCESPGCKYSQPGKGKGFPRAFAFILTSKDAGAQTLQVQLQSSDLTWEEPSAVRGQLMLQLGLKVAAVGRLLDLSVSSLY